MSAHPGTGDDAGMTKDKKRAGKDPIEDTDPMTKEDILDAVGAERPAPLVGPIRVPSAPPSGPDHEPG
jgi:hypothetical protein